MANLLCGRAWILRQQGFRAQDKSGRAIGTLKSVVIHESLLNRVQLAGFAEGSARFVSGNDEDGRQKTLISRINGGSFFAQLSPPDAANTNVWGGTFTLSDKSEDEVSGILIGVIRPSDPAGGGHPTLDSLIIATYGKGILSCQGGTGDVTINWGDQSLNGSFRAEFRLLAAVQRRAKQ